MGYEEKAPQHPFHCHIYCNEIASQFHSSIAS